jgi:predicted permease
VPAFRATDVQLATGLEETRRGVTAGRRRRFLSGALVAVQIALSLMLVAAAGLLVRSVRHLETVPLGFDAHNLLLFQIDPAAAGYTPERARQTIATVLDRVRAVPGVSAASTSSHRLMSNSSAMTAARRPEEAAPAPGSADVRTFFRTHGALRLTVDSDFFRTLRIPMLAGRGFSAADAGGQPVAVVNRLLAEQLFGTADAVGREFRLGSEPGEAAPFRILGVVADARYASIRRGFEPTAYLFDKQSPDSTRPVTFEARTEGAPTAIAPTVRDIIRQIDSTLPVSRVGTQLEQIDRSIRTERLFARLAAMLGLVALALSGIGLYGLLAYSVTQRTPEIGIRMALGAERTAVRWLVLRESMVLAAAGLVAGVPAALAGTRIVESLLYQLPARDPLTIGGAAAFMVVLALIAAYLPARRASRVDPMVALRSE